MLALSKIWAPRLLSQPETGMGYQIATVRLNNGDHFDNVVIRGGYIVSVDSSADIPFAEEDIADIQVRQ